jgi:hypothetical protein
VGEKLVASSVKCPLRDVRRINYEYGEETDENK